MRLVLDIFGDVQVDREILRLEDRVRDARPAWNAIRDDLLVIGEKQFDSRGGRAHPWPELADSTKEDKARRGKDPYAILEDGGDLRRALTQRGDKNQEFISEPDWMLFRPLLDYAEFHQRGRGVPQRRVIDLTEHDRDSAVKRLQSWAITGEP